MFDYRISTGELLDIRCWTHSKAAEFSFAFPVQMHRLWAGCCLHSCAVLRGHANSGKVDRRAAGQLHRRQMSVWPSSKNESVDSCVCGDFFYRALWQFYFDLKEPILSSCKQLHRWDEWKGTSSNVTNSSVCKRLIGYPVVIVPQCSYTVYILERSSKHKCKFVIHHM